MLGFACDPSVSSFPVSVMDLYDGNDLRSFERSELERKYIFTWL